MSQVIGQNLKMKQIESYILMNIFASKYIQCEIKYIDGQGHKEAIWSEKYLVSSSKADKIQGQPYSALLYGLGTEFSPYHSRDLGKIKTIDRYTTDIVLNYLKKDYLLSSTAFEFKDGNLNT